MISAAPEKEVLANNEVIDGSNKKSKEKPKSDKVITVTLPIKEIDYKVLEVACDLEIIPDVAEFLNEIVKENIDRIRQEMKSGAKTKTLKQK